MALFKCKMCGGALEISGNETVGTCEYCGTQQTLPKLDDDRRANLYDRANHFRRSNEFDKAMGMYERILNEDTTDAEAYWSLVLCRYGIEYVEDPATHKRIPTVNRAQYTSIFDDENYKLALQYADSYQRHIYEEEAKAINEIQKGILAISQKEEPFDVFICYKETDRNGRRTPDSVLANDLYHQLTQEGFKVFFSRITLEDKLGAAYEPYIFAALNSAKVMVVVGTKPDYFNAVWVKNEWSRYLSLIKNGAKKILIPAYRDMDPYDLPEEFSHLQAQDMSKLGFMQDLIRGIKKLAKTEEPKATVVKETVITGAAANTAPLLKRAFMFLEDEDWDSADEYCEKVLDIDPECAQAYLAKLMAELNVSKQEELRDQEEPFDEYNNYRKAIRFADTALKETLEGYIDYINDRNEKERLENAYNYSKRLMANASTEDAYKKAARSFETIPDYKDSAALAQECHLKAEEARKDGILGLGKAEMGKNTIPDYYSAIKYFASIPGWKDADERRQVCKEKIDELAAQAEADRLERERQAEIERLERERQAEIARREAAKRAKRNKTIAIVVSTVAVIAIAVMLLMKMVIIPNGKYNDAVALLEAGNYEEAAVAFEELGSHKNSAEMKLEADYLNATRMIAEKDFSSAIEILEVNPEYKDSQALYTDACYQYAHELWANEQYENAEAMFTNCGDYLDAKDMALMSNIMHLYGSKDYQSAYSVLKRVSDQFVNNNTELYENIYQNVVFDYATVGNIGLRDAVKILNTVPHPSQDISDIVSQYETILKCDGKYEFRSKETGNRYYFTIKRLFVDKQTIYADFEWTGYAGTFSDPGVVRFAPGYDYLCFDVVGTNSHTKNQQSFTLRVTPEEVICGFGYTYTRVE